MRKRSTSGRVTSSTSRSSLKFPSDLLIFSELICSMPPCIQWFANVQPHAASLWARSFSWCGNTRSPPPPWMSKGSPRYLRDMAEHSMCQPGRPCPHGEYHAGSPGLAAFHLSLIHI